MSLNPKIVPFERGADFVHQRAMKNLKDNRIIDALELMRKAVETSPENDGYRLELARLLGDAGCSAQSNRILLELYFRGVKPAECLYTAAVNQLNLNNPDSARKLLRKCRELEPDGMGAQADALTEEVNLYESLNRPLSRRLERIYRMTDEGCERLREEDFDGASSLFLRALEMDPAQIEVRALLSMVHMMQGEKEKALREADEASSIEDGTVRSLCVCAQVYNLAGNSARAGELLEAARELDADPLEQRMLLFTMFEAGLLDQAREEASRVLQDFPCDRQLLHTLAVIALKKEEPAENAAKYWKRILRIDPEDSIARYYLDTLEGGMMNLTELKCEYQVPKEEIVRRYRYLSDKLDGNLFALTDEWKNDAYFRTLVDWSMTSFEQRFQEAAVTLLSSVDDPLAEQWLREYLLRCDSSYDVAVRAAAMYHIRGLDVARILPPYRSDALLPSSDLVLGQMGVMYRQLVRLSSEQLERWYGISAEEHLAVLWEMYREKRGCRVDPLVRTEAAAAALAFQYLAVTGHKPDAAKLSRQFGCSKRQLLYFANHMASSLGRGGDPLGKID